MFFLVFFSHSRDEYEQDRSVITIAGQALSGWMVELEA